MKIIGVILIVLFMISSCTKITVLEVGIGDWDYLGNYDVSYTKSQLGNKWTTSSRFHTIEGVNVFISEADNNLSEWIIDKKEGN